MTHVLRYSNDSLIRAPIVQKSRYSRQKVREPISVSELMGGSVIGKRSEIKVTTNICPFTVLSISPYHVSRCQMSRRGPRLKRRLHGRRFESLLSHDSLRLDLQGFRKAVGVIVIGPIFTRSGIL